jgi:hypothetical protein
MWYKGSGLLRKGVDWQGERIRGGCRQGIRNGDRNY